MAEPNTSKPYTVPEVAAYLRLNRNTVYGMVNRGAIGSMHLGRKVRILPQQLAEYLGVDPASIPTPATEAKDPVSSEAPTVCASQTTRYAVAVTPSVDMPYT